MGYIYYAKKKAETPKRIKNEGFMAAALVDEGFYVLISNRIYPKNYTLRDIEKVEGRKSRKKTYRIGRRNQSKSLIA